ncbi:MAG: DUF2442 domain-containing protein [Victivallales bacterium]
MTKHHVVENLSFEENSISMSVDGRNYKFDITKISPGLSKASVAQRRNYVISPSGYGIHWPDIDEDLSIDALLGVKHVPSPMKFVTA